MCDFLMCGVSIIIIIIIFEIKFPFNLFIFHGSHSMNIIEYELCSAFFLFESTDQYFGIVNCMLKYHKTAKSKHHHVFDVIKFQCAGLYH
jgi:hypothetical protein